MAPKDYSAKKENNNEVKIAKEVISNIACMAATEVTGVAFLSDNTLTSEIIGRFGITNLAKGIRVDISEEGVSCDMSFAIQYGYSIPVVSQQVQNRVAAAVRDMTGLPVNDINVHIVGIKLENE